MECQLVSAAVIAVSLAFVAYVFIGYPALLALLARRRPKAVEKRFEPRTISVLLPVHNGEAWLDQKLRSILALDYPPGLIEIIVVSDGSTDRTAEIAREFASHGVTTLDIPKSGKAVALNEAIRRAKGEILFFTDVRQSLDPGSLRALVACFADPEVGAVSGELIIRHGTTLEEANVGLYWRYEKWIRKNQSRLDSLMGATGCIYAMRASLARPLAPGTILDDVELPLGAFLAGRRVVLEEGARAYDYPTSIPNEFRRKVRTLSGVYQTIWAHPVLLGPDNRLWLHFVSHKLARLLLPWALLAALAASFGLPHGWREAALAAHAAFYALVLLDFVTPERFPAKRLTSPARTLFALITAAFFAAFYPLMPKGALWGTTKVNVK